MSVVQIELDIIEVPHRREASCLHPIEPMFEALCRWPTRAQAPCPAHCQRCENCPVCLASRDARRRDRCFHPIALLLKARKTPEMKPHAGAGDRMKIGGLFHQIQPTARAIVEALGIFIDVFGIAVVEEGCDIDYRVRTACQSPNGLSNSRQSIWVVLCA
jgi:hypothetical protein